MHVEPIILFANHCICLIWSFLSVFVAVKNITTASYCGGINTIIRNILDTQVLKCVMFYVGHGG